jgi:hypothetical protein
MRDAGKSLICVCTLKFEPFSSGAAQCAGDSGCEASERVMQLVGITFDLFRLVLWKPQKVRHHFLWMVIKLEKEAPGNKLSGDGAEKRWLDQRIS